MTELPGSAAIGIEAVEWVAEGGGSLIIRVTGRWRRRRPASSGQATLVIEAEGHRHRFTALPEPPSLTGAGPGMWQLRFSVPGSLAPDLGGRTWLQFGTVIVPLPAAVSPPGEPGPARPEDDPEAGAERAPLVPVPEAPLPMPGPPAPVPETLGPVPEPPGGSGSASETAEEPAAPGPVERSTRDPDRIADLERELDEARAGRDQLQASIAERDRARRAAEQRAHAEQALRRDLARQLAASVREGEGARQAMGELADAEHRIRTLEHQLSDARRRSDEAEQVAAAAQAARERAERQQAARAARLEFGETARLALEQDLLRRRAGTGERVPSEPALRAPAARPSPSGAGGAPIESAPPVASSPPIMSPLPVATPAADQPSAPPAPDPLVETLRRELDARAQAEAGLRARLVDAEARLAARVLLEQRTTATLTQLRVELEGLRSSFASERAQRLDAERQAAGLRARVAELERELGGQHERTQHAHEAISELREALERLQLPEPQPEPESGGEALSDADTRAPPDSEPGAGATLEPGSVDPASADSEPAAGPAPPTDPAGRVEPARLHDALVRLRQSVAPEGVSGASAPGGDRPGEPAPARPPLRPVFERLVALDAEAAGRLLLELLPLQRDAYPRAVSYDLVLGADGCVCVTVLGGPPEITLQSSPRPREAVDFQVFGAPARIARLLVARALRRRFGRRMAKVTGRRDRIAALEALLQTPLDLLTLHREGVRLDAGTALELACAMVDPAWTARERFTLAHRDPGGAVTYLEVADGRPMTVTRTAPGGRIATTITCPADDLLPVLARDSMGAERIEGDLGPLAALRGWINRAQSG